MEPSLLYVTITLSLIVIGLSFWIKHLATRLQDLSTGVDKQNLSSIISQNNKHLQELSREHQAFKQNLTKVETSLQYSVQNVSLIRFNPYQDTGGNQSFSLALLDDNGTGMVLSSLYTREQARIFAKPVVNQQSSFTLSSEEQEAIANAMK